MLNEHDDDDKVPCQTLCASNARAEYGLTDAQLGTLNCTYAQNPHYRSSYPMRLYQRADLEQLSDMVEEEKQWKLEHADEIWEEKQTAAKRMKTEARNNALNALSVKESCSSTEKHHPFLPEAMWREVLQFMMLEKILRGPDAVYCDILALRQCSKIMYPVAETALYLLSAASPTLPDTCADWDRLVAQPMSFNLGDLKTTAKSLKLKTSVTKPVLCVSILQFFGLQKPAAIPARVLNAMKEERTLMVNDYWILAEVIRDLQERNLLCETLKTARRNLRTIGITTISDLEKAQHIQEVQREEKEKLRIERLLETRGNRAAGSCICTNKAALACIYNLCGRCCTSNSCPRHR